jgi:hypothetical protein
MGNFPLATVLFAAAVVLLLTSALAPAVFTSEVVCVAASVLFRG